MPGQNLYYLYSACRALGYEAKVVDANWSIDPVGELLDPVPDTVLISAATPGFAGTIDAIDDLRRRGYHGPIFVGGPHVSLNVESRPHLLPERTGVHYVPLIQSNSTFEWVPTVFPGRSAVEVTGRPPGEAEEWLRDTWLAERGGVIDGPADRLLFSSFAPTFDWMNTTYRGGHVLEQMRDVPLRHSIVTSIGCSRSCSFCGNPYIYRIGFKLPSVVRQLIRRYKEAGIDRISVHDMFFVMNRRHALKVAAIMKEEEMQFSMQTCLENLDDQLLANFAESGLKKFLVGIENPVSYSVGKTVEMDKLRWLLRTAERLGFEGVKLSYIVGLPGATVEADLALLDHIVDEITSRGHPLHDLQVNLYTPYRPEPDSEYVSYVERRGFVPVAPGRRTIHLLDALSFRYWGSFPVGVASAADLHTQMVLCDVIYDVVYREFVESYLENRAAYVDDLARLYPDLVDVLPSFDQSRRFYREAARTGPATRRPGQPVLIGDGQRTLADPVVRR